MPEDQSTLGGTTTSSIIIALPSDGIVGTGAGGREISGRHKLVELIRSASTCYITFQTASHLGDTWVVLRTWPLVPPRVV